MIYLFQTLADHWPRLPDDQADLEEDIGSGFGSSRNFFNTDDEDLLNTNEFGSGSGDGSTESDLEGHHHSTDSDVLEPVTKSKTPHNTSPTQKQTPRTPPSTNPEGSGCRQPYSSSISNIITWLVLGVSLRNYYYSDRTI